MADLIAKSPCDGLLPLVIGGVSLTEEDPGILTAIGPYRGREKTVSDILRAVHGMALPGPGRSTGKAGARAIWFGRGHVLLAGPAPDPGLSEHAALVDQTDAWAVVRLEGWGAVDVLARVVPVDLRAPAFKRGQTVRSLVMHMAASITKTGDRTFQIMVFRSMADTLVHDLKVAMESVAARR